MYGDIPDNDEVDKFSDQEVLARTLWGENRGGGTKGMTSVANVIMNRVHSGITWWGNSVRSVCLKPYQFSCWLASDPNRAKLLSVTDEDPAYREALFLAAEAIAGTLPDITGGATSYFAISMPKPPHWSVGMTPTAEIAGQRFYYV